MCLVLRLSGWVESISIFLGWVQPLSCLVITRDRSDLVFCLVAGVVRGEMDDNFTLLATIIGGAHI